MITIHTISYNEEMMLPYFIEHYRKMFPDCRIVIYDNESTDHSFNIAMSYGNIVWLPYSTGGKLSDKTYLEIKNNCWKSAATDWVLIADIDEHLYINQHELQNESDQGATVIIADGYNMVNLNEDLLVENIHHGVRAQSYDKFYLFNKAKIPEICYGPGAHRASPVGKVRFSKKNYICKHYKYVNIDYMIARHANFASRLSDDNIKKGYGSHYRYSEDVIRAEFNEARKKAIKII